MSKTHTVENPVTGTGAATDLEGMYQVVLFNDDVNTMEHVLKALMQVFGHPEQLAMKIMVEAHNNGKAVAEVESKTKASHHRDQLQSFGLTATVEKI